jgi:ABC-type antimicrobial peptide transport system permease subunit
VIGVALKSLWGRKLRTLLTAFSIVLGTTMIAGTFVVKDQITNAFGAIFETGLEKTDVVLSKKTAFNSDQAQAGPLPAADIAAAAAVPGVAKAEGQVQASGALVVGGKYTGASGGAPSLVLSTLSETFTPYNYIHGHAPQQSGDVIVNEKLADDKHLKVGQHELLATEVGIKPVTIVGIFKYGNVSSIGGATIVGTTFEDAQAWFNRTDLTSVVYLKADSGVSPEELKKRVAAALPNDVKVQTGQEAAKEQTDQVAGGINSFLTPLLLAFAFTAVLVGAFIIFNTFSITVAHRTREFAILRTLGASRRQVLRSVLLEATLIGLLASALGIVLGIGFAKLLGLLFDRAGFGLPEAPIRISVLTVVLVPLAVGTLTALLSAIAPAFRATRVPPVAALREGAELPPSVLARHATPISALILAVGLGEIVDGIFNDGSVLGAVIGFSKTASILLSMGIGAVLCFVSVAMLSKHIVRPLAGVIGLLLGWLIAFLDWIGAIVMAVPKVGRPMGKGWYLVRRGLSFLLACALFVLPGAAVAAILLLVAKPLAIAAIVVTVPIAIAAVARVWLSTPSEWPPEPTVAAAGSYRFDFWRVIRRYVALILAPLAVLLIGREVVATTIFDVGGHIPDPFGTGVQVLGAVLGIAVVVTALAMIVLAWRAGKAVWPPRAPSRQTGRLARENTIRNTSRTATTASALMIGVGLVVFVAVFVNGFKDSFLGALDRSVTSDLIIQPDNFDSGMPREAVSAAGAVPGVQVSTGIQITEAKIGHGGTDEINGIDPTLFGQVYTFNWQKGGSDTLLGEFTGDEALIEEQFAKSHHLEIGDHFKVTSIEGTTLDLKVFGQYKDPTLMTGFTIPSVTFDRFTTNVNPGVLLVKFRSGVDVATGKADVAKALKAFPIAKVRTNAEYKTYTEDQVNGFLSFLYVLLAMSLVISLFGIVNTLALSVFERTREIGMLRAVGTTRRQLRRMIRYEAVITSVIGGVLGVAVGLVFGWILSRGLADQGIVFSIPYSLMLIVLIGAAIAGVMSAILPARRAAQLDVLEALQYE